MSTIYALSSAKGIGGVAVVRVSGEKVAQVLEQMLHTPLPQAREVFLRKIYHPDTQSLLDQAMVVLFEGPKSFTGEDCLEFHLHGGQAVVDSVLDALASIDGLRLALPGEFTRRAFENGKLDLTSAEAVGDLIHAETEHQQQQALQQMGGALANLYQGWCDLLAKILAYAEAEIDFPDEELPESLVDRLSPKILQIQNEIENHLNDSNRGERLRDGVRIALLGAPNAGKSSLLNAIAKRDVAIVTDLPGTTRDVLELRLDLGGYPVIFCDTAGIRDMANAHDAQDKIEAEGIRRSLERAEEADIKVLVFDGSQLPNMNEDILKLRDQSSLCVFNKADIANIDETLLQDHDALALAAISGDGLSKLLDALLARIEDVFKPGAHASLTRARHREALNEALAALVRARETQAEDELLAEDLRIAIRCIGRITGRVDVEDLLDIIFRDFCIGK